MDKYYTAVKKLLLLLILVTACNNPTVPEISYLVTIQPNLPYSNEYYYLDLIDSYKQTIARLDGQVIIDGTIPERPVKVSWESNLYWTLEYNNSIADDERVITKYPNKVATINPASYTYDGRVSTMIGPIYEMKNDTMIVILTYESVSDTIRIILQ